MKIILLTLLPLNLFGFTLNTSNAVSFDTDVIKVRVSDRNCTNISATADQLESWTRDAINQFWYRIPATKLNLEVVGQTTLDNAFRTESVCSAVTPQGECTPNQNMLVNEGIIISCNVDTANDDNFGAGHQVEDPPQGSGINFFNPVKSAMCYIRNAGDHTISSNIQTRLLRLNQGAIVGLACEALGGNLGTTHIIGERSLFSLSKLF